jgi:hypothetical protein
MLGVKLLRYSRSFIKEALLDKEEKTLILYKVNNTGVYL